jgi:hypothetical protein
MYTVDVIVLGLGSVFSSVLIFAGHFNRSGKSVLESEVVQVVEHLAKRKVHMINHVIFFLLFAKCSATCTGTGTMTSLSNALFPLLLK